jgi:hypothetical protein
MILLLLPWLPIAVWSLVFLGDPILEYSAVPILFGKGIPFFVVVYPIFLVHGTVSSWFAVRQGKSTSLIFLKALYPLLLIIPVLMIIIIFLKK